MSHHINTEWLESAKDNFDEAMLQGDTAQAMAVVGDIADAGFKAEAAYLGKEVIKAKYNV